MENEHNLEEYESILASINDSSTNNDSDDGYISTNTLEEIWDGNYIHPDINKRYPRLKIRDHIRKAQGEWKGMELSEKTWAKVYIRSSRSL